MSCARLPLSVAPSQVIEYRPESALIDLIPLQHYPESMIHRIQKGGVGDLPQTVTCEMTGLMPDFSHTK